MTQKKLWALDWIGQDPHVRSGEKETLEVELRPHTFTKLPEFKPLLRQNSLIHSRSPGEFDPSLFVTEGWAGLSLPSKLTIKVSQFLHNLLEDCENDFSLNHFSRSQKDVIFQEFQEFCTKTELHCPYQDSLSFSKELVKPVDERDQVLHFFTKRYLAQVVVFYFLKIRFLCILRPFLHGEIDENFYLNPQSLLNKIFSRGGRFELKSKIFDSNAFSWYRPRPHLAQEIEEVLPHLGDLNFAEISKMISPFFQTGQKPQPYSHALSHLNFGLFLNSLLINFPLWLKSIKGEEIFSSQRKNEEFPEAISCLYLGDYDESLSASHWLAQESNKFIRWDQILCPHFKADECSGGFPKLLNEIQFMSFLPVLAKEQGHEPLQFICSVVKSHFEARKSTDPYQADLLYETRPPKSRYDCLVLSPLVAVKNNPHFHIINFIQSSADRIRDDGLIFVLAGKNILIPSQKERLDKLFKALTLEGVFNLENIEGKGEVPSHLYVFSKKNLAPGLTQQKKESCLTFNFKGELKAFCEIQKVTDQLQRFFNTNLFHLPPAYFFEDKGMKLEFFQDALLHGQLVRSSKNSGEITHPEFYKNLLANCLPLDHFFKVSSTESDSLFEPGELPIHPGLQNHFPLAIVINNHDPHEAEFEIIPSSALSHVIEQRGRVSFSFFGLTPKHPGFDINLLRLYLASPLGRQVANLSFFNNRHYKSNLLSLMIPKFFLETKNTSSAMAQSLDFLEFRDHQLRNCSVKDLENYLAICNQIGRSLLHKNPRYVLSKLGSFTQALNELGMDNPKEDHHLFASKNFQGKLTQLTCRSLTEKGTDVFLEYENTSKGLLDSNIESLKTERLADGIYKVSLLSQDRPVLSLHCHYEQSLFLVYILGKILPRPLKSLISGLKIPDAQELEKSFQHQKEMGRYFEEFSQHFNQLFNQLLQTAVMKND